MHVKEEYPWWFIGRVLVIIFALIVSLLELFGLLRKLGLTSLFGILAALFFGLSGIQDARQILLKQSQALQLL